MKDEQVLVVIIMRLDEGNDKIVCSCLYVEREVFVFHYDGCEHSLL